MASELPSPTIEPPIFVFADDLSSFDSVDDATAYIEPWDVAEVTEAFDGVGRRLIVTADGVERTRHTVGGGTTTIVVDPTAGADPSPLGRLLRSYLAEIDLEGFGLTDLDLRTAPLAELVEAVHPLTITR